MHASSAKRWIDNAVADRETMPIYKDSIYPYLVHKLGDPPPIRAVRQQLIPFARGKVLEIGAGSGANFPYYSTTEVSRLYALEPNKGMIRLAEKRLRQTALNIEFIGLPGERIPLEDEMIDTAVSTFTLCTIPGIREAIREVARVLKPGGYLLFFELGCSPESRVQRRQKQLEPICRWLFQGLRLTRDIPSLLVRGGFQIRQMEAGYLADFPKPLTYSWWGTAVKVDKFSKSRNSWEKPEIGGAGPHGARTSDFGSPYNICDLLNL